MSKNIVVLCDGTGNEPGIAGNTNVLRLYDGLAQDEQQVVWYDPGVGTQGSAKALTAVGRALTKAAGLLFGYGLKENVIEAYQFLMHTYETGDQIYLFGFSRGAYTARAIAGLLYQIGLLRRGQENLLPYALKLFWWDSTKEASKETWTAVRQFSTAFARPDFPGRKDEHVHFLGVWDTVKAAGHLRGALVLPWTAQLPGVRTIRHAVSIDERRRPFKPNLISRTTRDDPARDCKEVWFAGVHSDVGGTFAPDHQLADIALAWMASEADAAGLSITEELERVIAAQNARLALGAMHGNKVRWYLRPTTWLSSRTITPDDARVHESVSARMAATAGAYQPYQPRLPRRTRWEPWPHTSDDGERRDADKEKPDKQLTP